MKLWETQLKFAVHCATSGLGISTEHLDVERPLVRALYRFHTYYHVRRILSRIRAPTQSEGFDKYNNAFSLEEVRRVGNEYGCSTENLSISRNQYFFNKSGRGSHNNWSRWIISSYHLNRRRDTALLGMELKLQQLRRFLLIILRMLSIK